MTKKRWNSRLPEVWKYRGNGKVVVFQREFSLKKKGFKMLAKEDKLLSGNYESSELTKLTESVSQETRLTGLSKIISDPNFLVACWVRIRSKKGGNTPALTQTTLDGINQKWFLETANKISNGAFKFKPSKRVLIPKKGGKKKRPLTIPSPRDKIVQEGIRFLLEIIFEPTFSNHSHGFRPSFSCHTALNYIRTRFGYCNWYIEGDITKQFDSVNQNKLIKIIETKVNDQAFIDLIWKALRSGYGNPKSPHKVVPQNRGIPQGGVMSPLLSNIYMSIFDKEMETIISEFNKGLQRRANPEYSKALRNKSPDLFTIRPGIGNDENFKRLRYVRYADDFLLGVIGSRSDCIELRERISVFLKEELDLTLNIEKTKISHATDDGAFFLGYKIHNTPFAKQPVEYVKHGSKWRRTRKTPRPLMDAPVRLAVQKFTEGKMARHGGKPTRCGKLIHLTPFDIVNYYKRLERSTLNYYSLASNYGRFTARVHYILKYSCALTLAAKLRMKTLKKTFKKFGYNLVVYGKKKQKTFYPTPSYKKPRHFVGSFNFNPLTQVGSLSDKIGRERKDLSGPCIGCGAMENIEVHHVNHLKKDLSKDWLTRTMQKINRKQVPLCADCHRKVHQGTYSGVSIRK